MSTPIIRQHPSQPTKAHRPDVGDLIEIDQQVWRRDGIENIFDLRTPSARAGQPNELEFEVSRHYEDHSVRGRVVFREMDVLNLVGQPEPAPRTPDTGTEAAISENAAELEPPVLRDATNSEIY